MSRENYKKSSRVRRFFVITGWIIIGASVITGMYYLIIGMRYWVDRSAMFQTAQVEISGLSILTDADIKSRIGGTIPTGKKIFEIGLQPVKKSLQSHPYVKQVSLGKKFPNTVRIDIVERVPFAYISLDKVMLVDKEGCILPKLAGRTLFEDLPVITGISCADYRAGEILHDERILRAAAMLKIAHKNLPELEKSISEIHFNSEGELAVFLNGSGVRIEFGTDGYEMKVEKLRYFLEFCEAHSIINSFEYINLNYQDQVVVKNRI